MADSALLADIVNGGIGCDLSQNPPGSLGGHRESGWNWLDRIFLTWKRQGRRWTRCRWTGYRQFSLRSSINQLLCSATKQMGTPALGKAYLGNEFRVARAQANFSWQTLHVRQADM